MSQVMPHARSPQFSDPFYVNFLTGLRDEVATYQRDLLVISCPPESEKERQMYRQRATSHRVDGVVINCMRQDGWRVDYQTENNIPYGSLRKGSAVSVYLYVDIEDSAAIQQLVVHLAQKGHGEIAYIGASPNLVVQSDPFGRNLNGPLAAWLRPDESLAREGDWSEAGGNLAARALLNQSPPPTAILGCNDFTTQAVPRAAKDRGISIDTGLAIAGYDGIKETEYTSPPITTIHQPACEIARQLTLMEVRLIEGQLLDEQVVSGRPDLIIRASPG